MICCDTYIDLGCLNGCAPLDFGLATMDGVYTLLLEYNDAVSFYELDVLTGEQLEFDVKLNESYFYTAKLIDPDGDFVCYKFKTKIYVS
jgi:hypothetical protein